DDQRPPPAAGSSTTRRPPVFSSSTTSTRRPSPAATARPPRPTTSRPPVVTQPPPKPPSAEFTCRQDGMFADPRNCRKFIRCVSLGSGWQTYKFDCGPGTAFNEQQGYCDHIYNVPSCSSSSSSSRSTPNSAATAQATIIGAGPAGNNNNYLPARVMDQHLVLARQYYPNYFQHQFMVHHRWLH
ncbi:serine-rich adhesin for platelets-like, partial [Olea europaea subsp. europaea]